MKIKDLKTGAVLSKEEAHSIIKEAKEKWYYHYQQVLEGGYLLLGLRQTYLHPKTADIKPFDGPYVYVFVEADEVIDP